MSEKAVLMSIKPKWVYHILVSQDKIFEVRKRAPLLATPFKVYVYCTGCLPTLFNTSDKWRGYLNGHVCGEFTCTGLNEMNPPWFSKTEGTRLTAQELAKYAQGEKLVYMEISNPILYDMPIKLEEFGVKRAPQSFQYVMDEQNKNEKNSIIIEANYVNDIGELKKITVREQKNGMYPFNLWSNRTGDFCGHGEMTREKLNEFFKHYNIAERL